MSQIDELCGELGEERASLHMCTEQSNPSKELNGAVRPIMAEKPVVGHPPLFVNVKSTSTAFPRGAMTHSGMMTAKRPVI
jgi:hypothetical protein